MRDKTLVADRTSCILHRAARACGFTYAGILVAVAMIGVGLAVAGEVWQTAVQREKERELLFVSDEIRRAITQYYESTPGTGKQFPKSLDDMLRDNRYPTVRRYLRKFYRDPMTGSREWGLVKGPGNGIMGVYSLSRKSPLKQANFPAEYASFNNAESFAAWQFAYTGAPVTAGGPAAPGASAPAPGLPPPASTPIPTTALIGQVPASGPAGAAGVQSGKTITGQEGRP